MELVLKYFPALTSKQIQQFAALKKLYADWNEKINVISRKDIDNFYEHHVLHSLAIAKQFNFPKTHHMLDLGTGGGFPGLPLAIYFPEVQFYLADSIKKKLKVINEITSTIDLTNIITEHTRAEEIKAKTFEVIVSRAVAPLKDLLIWSKPLLSKKNNQQQTINGLICLKGGDLKKEIAESNCRPEVFQIEKLFEEDFFKEKYILYVPF